MLPAVAALLRPILAAGIRRAVAGTVAKSAAKHEFGKTLGRKAAGEAIRAFASSDSLKKGEAGKAARAFAKAAKSGGSRGGSQQTPGGRYKLDLSGLRNLFGRSQGGQPKAQQQPAGNSQQAAKLAKAFSQTPPPAGQTPAQSKSLQSTQAFTPTSTPPQPAATQAFPQGAQPGQTPARGFPVGSLSPQSAAPNFPTATPIAQPVSAQTFNQSQPAPQSSGGFPRDSDQKPRSFAGLATRNFGDLLSGKTTPEEVNAKADAEDQEGERKLQAEKDKATREEAVDQLKNLGKAAIGGVTGLVALPGIAKKFTEALVSSQEGLRRFNGQIGIAFAKLERGEIRRQRESGARTSGTLVPLVDATNQMKDEVQKLKDVGSNLMNTVAVPMAKGVTQLVRGVNYIASKLGLISKTPPQMGPWQQHLVNMQQRHTARRNQAIKQMSKPQPNGPPGGGKGGQP